MKTSSGGRRKTKLGRTALRALMSPHNSWVSQGSDKNCVWTIIARDNATLLLFLPRWFISCLATYPTSRGTELGADSPVAPVDPSTHTHTHILTCYRLLLLLFSWTRGRIDEGCFFFLAELQLFCRPCRRGRVAGWLRPLTR